MIDFYFDDDKAGTDQASPSHGPQGRPVPASSVCERRGSAALADDDEHAG